MPRRFAQECQAFWAEHLAAAGAATAPADAWKDAGRKRKPKGTFSDEARDASRSDTAAGMSPSGEVMVVHSAVGGPAATPIEAAGSKPKTPTTPLPTAREGWPAEAGAAESAAGHTSQGGRIRKAKVRWEPEEITATEKKKRPPDAPPREVAAVPTPAGQRRAKRPAPSSGPLPAKGRGMYGGEAHVASAALGAATLVPFGSHMMTDVEEDPDASLLDVAAHLPEIDVGDHLEGVACDLEGLLDDLPPL